MSVFGVTSSNPFSSELTGLGNNFVITSLSKSDSKNVAVPRGPRGEFAGPGKSTGETTSISMTMTSVVTTALTGLALKLGCAGTQAITQLTINTQAGQFATINITGHKHGTGDSHNKSERTITIPDFIGFGASLFDVEGDFGESETLGVTETELQSSSYQISIEHKDEITNEGDFLCGSSYGVTETLSFEAISDTAWNTAALEEAGWVVQQGNLGEDGKEEGNTAHVSRRITLVKHSTATPTYATT